MLECLKRTSSNDGRYDPVMGYGIPNPGRAVRECKGKRRFRAGAERARRASRR